MNWKHLSLATLGAAAFAVQPAHASGSAAMVFPMVTPIWAQASALPCREEAPAAATGIAVQSKSGAILGGNESALERMRREQAQAATFVNPAPALPSFPASTACFAMPKPVASATLAAPAIAQPFREDEFLATRLLKIGKTPFDREWKRVERRRLGRNKIEQLVGRQEAGSENALAAVNAYVNSSVSYRDDRETASSGDYWQSAAETLRRGTGDCEDFAIAKYQMLRGLGFEADDLYVTLARDLARNVDHAVLIVRVGDRHLMLDDATDTLIDAREANDYRAMFSFGSRRAFMHGIPNDRISG